jgi:hypothetical protein
MSKHYLQVALGLRLSAFATIQPNDDFQNRGTQKYQEIIQVFKTAQLYKMNVMPRNSRVNK